MVTQSRDACSVLILSCLQAYTNAVLKEFLTSGLAVSAANVCTNPIGAAQNIPPAASEGLSSISCLTCPFSMRGFRCLIELHVSSASVSEWTLAKHVRQQVLCYLQMWSRFACSSRLCS